MGKPTSGPGSWYRLVSKSRRTKRTVLRSTEGRFHEHAENEPTSYGADSLETAWLEVTARFGQASGNPHAFRAWRLTVADPNLVDLRDPEKQRCHHITAELLFADPSPHLCKEAARRLRREGGGSDGLIYPSVRNQPDGVCVALFLEHVYERITIEAADTEWEQFVRSP